MAMKITENYNNYAAQSIAESGMVGRAQKTGAEKTVQASKHNKAISNQDYMEGLKKLAPSVKFKIGFCFSSEKTGKTLTIDPRLLAKMQSDPEQERETKELIRGVESMTKLVEGLNKASGRKTIFRHSYIDENGKYCHISLTVNEFGNKLSKKIREMQRKNSEKLLKIHKEKTAMRKEALAEMLESSQVEKEGKNPAPSKAEQFIKEKIATSKDGLVYLNNTDFRALTEAIQKGHAGAGRRAAGFSSGRIDRKA